MTNPFNEAYFMDGVKAGVSNYENYRWLPEITKPACQSVIRYLGIKFDETLLDFGCGPGMYVRAYRELGHLAWGYDISEWAIKNCDPSVVAYVSNKTPLNAPYWIIAKDVLEHVPYPDLKKTIKFFMEGARKGVLICVPLTTEDGGSYVLEADNKDSTHVIRWPFHMWLEFLQEQIDELNAPFLVSGGHRLPGLKEYGGLRHNGCGFFTLKRI